MKLLPTCPALIPICALLLTFGVAVASPKLAPSFELKDLDGKTHRLADHKGKVVVIEFFNPDCPFIKRAHANKDFVDTIKWSQTQGVQWFAINANAAGKQGAALERNVIGKAELKIDFPILLNPDGTIGKAYGATRTPEMVIINAEGKLVYQGGVDSSGGSRRPKDAVKPWFKTALENTLKNKPIEQARTKPWGCSVKY